jgi:hypothetical protein
MKNLIIIFLLITTRLFGQNHNEKIIKFVDDNLGKKVGDGVCITLVESAIRTYRPLYKAKKFSTKKRDFWSVPATELKEGEEAIAGDIIWMYGGDTLNHIAIFLGGDEDGKYYIAEQNTNETLEESVVIISEFDYYMDGVTYVFYRPK